MIISDVKHTIDALEKALPTSFAFVLDTTDRSFLYKSMDRHDCSEDVIRIDRQYGVDQLMKNLTFTIHEENNNRMLLKKIDNNSFIGVCILQNEFNEEVLRTAQEILMK